jgi:hypothetical protein
VYGLCKNFSKQKSKTPSADSVKGASVPFQSKRGYLLFALRLDPIAAAAPRAAIIITVNAPMPLSSPVAGDSDFVVSVGVVGVVEIFSHLA